MPSKTSRQAIASTIAQRLPVVIALLVFFAPVFLAMPAVANDDLGLAATTMAGDDSELNAVGAVITVTDDENGTLEYKVTEPAGQDGAYGAVKLTSGAEYTSENLVLASVSQRDGDAVYNYNVTAVGYGAFKDNTSIKRIDIQSDLTGASPAVGASAFEGCVSLEAVSFPQHVAGIGNSAFSGCVALGSIVFPACSELYTNNTTNQAAIGQYAFRGCEALESIKIPAITSATRMGDAYYSFSEYNPGTNQTIGVGNLNIRYCSGDHGWWHSGGGPVQRPGIGDQAFSGCASLKTVVFETGPYLGAYAYFWLGKSFFENCGNLETIVCEATQPYAMNPDGAKHNGTQTDMFADFEQRPTLYYAVDYYLTEEAANSSDTNGSDRIARCEYARGTSTAAIARGNAQELASSMPEASVYAQEGYRDGEVINPNEAAVAAFGESAEGKAWVWRLMDSQSRRAGLCESCKAYLAEASDIEFGRIDSAQTEAQYRACTMNFSRGTVQDTTFDPDRYYNPERSYGSTPDDSDYYTVGRYSVWFNLNSSLEQSFFGNIKIITADGTELPWESCEVSFQRFDSETEQYDDVELGEVDGPLLMSVTPNESSGYTGVLKEWVLVRGRSGSVRECYSVDASDTWRYAVYHNSVNSNPAESFSGPYAVRVGAADATSALVAAGYAGIVGAPITVNTSAEALENDRYGFDIALRFAYWGVPNGDIYSYPNSETRFTTPQDYSNDVYKTFASKRNGYNAPASEYPWGDAALVVDPKSLNDVAAAAASYAYSAKAPVFYTATNGAANETTIANLKSFGRVLILGDASVFSERAERDLRQQLGNGTEVVRLCGDARSSSSLSRAVAKALGDSGLATMDSVAVVVGGDPLDAIGALDFAAHEGGVVLTASSTADAKVISADLRSNRDDVSTVRLFGRDGQLVSSSSFDLSDSLSHLWSSEYVEPVIGAGDTLALSGVLFNIGSNGSSLALKSELWPHVRISSGTYSYEGASYVLASNVRATIPGIAEPAAEPAAKVGLVYNGKAQTGVAADEGFTVEGGSATDAGDYTATAKLAEGYEWADGTTADKTVRWSIAKAKATVPAGKTLTFNGKEQTGVAAGTGYTLKGNTATNGGSYEATATLAKNYQWADGSAKAKTIAWKINAAKQTVTAKAKKATLKAKNLKKKAQVVKASVVKKNVKAKTAITYKKVKANKKAKYFKVAKDGKITVKKGLAKGTYKVTVKATAKATANYQSASKNFVVTVKVK